MNARALFTVAPDYIGDSVTVTLGAWELVAQMAHDPDMGAPWEEHDGHGDVTDWTRRDKLPGELVLVSDDRSSRFYDFAGACAKARLEGWRSGDDSERARKGEPDNGTKRQIAARAAMADYKRLKGWCDDSWTWCGFIVKVRANGYTIGTASLWGIESDCDEYGLEVCNELLAQAIDEARETLGAKVAENCEECENAKF